MAHEVRGVVAHAKQQPVTVETIVVPDPGPGEALVQIQACGVCHTDLHYREGGINDDFPFLLGHEAAGVVEAVGSGRDRRRARRLRRPQLAGGVRRVPGVPARAGPGTASRTHNATQRMTLADGTELSPGARASAPSPRRRSSPPARHEGRSRASKPEAAGLLGCGVMAGLGAAMLTGEVGHGDSVAVFGCGGVGDAAIAGARLAGAHTIIAVDLDPRKLELAKEFGATHTVDASKTDPVEAIQGSPTATAPTSASRRSGNPKVLEQAFYARDLAGTVVQVGVPNARHAHRPPDDRLLRPRRRAQAVAGTATACRAATSRCSSTSTSRAGSRSTSS